MTKLRQIIKSEVSRILREWADEINFGKTRLDYKDEGAYPFGEDHGGIMSIGYEGEAHATTGISTHKRAGRVWTKEKIISFWNYPHTKNELVALIAELNALAKNQNLPFQIDSTWKIDFPDVDRPIKSQEIDYGAQSIFVPITNYSMYVRALRNAHKVAQEIEAHHDEHIKSPIKKKKVAVPKGWGSNTPDSELTPSQKAAKLDVAESVNEWADGFLDPDDSSEKYHDYHDRDAYAFGFTESKPIRFKVLPAAKTHIRGGLKGRAKWAGRAWSDPKVISFWKYPRSFDDLQKAIKLINKSAQESDLNFKVDDSWRVEFIDFDSNTMGAAQLNPNSDYGEDRSWLIPITDRELYSAALVNIQGTIRAQAEKERIAKHMQSPMSKIPDPVPFKWGSNQPDTLPSASQRDALRGRSESMEHKIKLKMIREWADEMNIGNESIEYNDYKSYPFGIKEKGKFIIGNINSTHSDSNIKSVKKSGRVEHIRKRIKDLGNFAGKLNIPINGNDVIRIIQSIDPGFKPGKMIGDILDAIKDKFLENPNISKDEAEKIVIDTYKQMK